MSSSSADQGPSAALRSALILLFAALTFATIPGECTEDRAVEIELLVADCDVEEDPGDPSGTAASPVRVLGARPRAGVLHRVERSAVCRFVTALLPASRAPPPSPLSIS